MKKEELIEIAEILYEEKFTYSEAYPISRWKRNKWPKLTDVEYKIIDCYIKFLKLCEDLNE